jgi:DNA-directed RNA polymerase subunit RPC12/RpoP
MRKLPNFDLTIRCTHCDYRIPPAELLRIDGEHIRCPKCGKDFIPETKKSQSIGIR